MKANIGSAGLPSARTDEVVVVRRQAAEAVERCGRAVRDDALFGVALRASRVMVAGETPLASA